WTGDVGPCGVATGTDRSSLCLVPYADPVPTSLSWVGQGLLLSGALRRSYPPQGIAVRRLVTSICRCCNFQSLLRIEAVHKQADCSYFPVPYLVGVATGRGSPPLLGRAGRAR